MHRMMPENSSFLFYLRSSLGAIQLWYVLSLASPASEPNFQPWFPVPIRFSQVQRSSSTVPFVLRS